MQVHSSWPFGHSSLASVTVPSSIYQEALTPSGCPRADNIPHGAEVCITAWTAAEYQIEQGGIAIGTVAGEGCKHKNCSRLLGLNSSRQCCGNAGQQDSCRAHGGSISRTRALIFGNLCKSRGTCPEGRVRAALSLRFHVSHWGRVKMAM